MKRNQTTAKRLLAAALAAVMFFTLTPQQVRADDYWPDSVATDCASAIVMEINTGTVLYEKKAHKKRYPASITKIMTALLTIENCALDETVTFSADAVYKNEGDTSNIARDLNEELTVEQCLYAVMLESANECAYALAEHVGAKLGGDYQTFIDLMNTRAAELGCTDTHFNNCNGLPDEEHWVSAYDMALIAAEAYRNETFRSIAGTSSYTIPKTNKHDEEYPCHNHHKMIYPFRGDSSQLYDYCTGGKTGYTNAAGSTLVSYAEKDGITLVCVTLKGVSPAHYTDTRKLFDYCFDNFQALNITENDTELASASDRDFGLLNTNEPYAKPDEAAYIIMPKAASFSDAVCEKTDAADSGTLARLTYTYAGREVGHADILKTGAEVTDNYFQDNASISETDGQRVIRVRPEWIAAVLLLAAVLAVVIFLFKRFYDNFYMIRHQRNVRRLEKQRFKETKPKKRHRKRDRLFK